jgi:hypothetical protein
MKDKKLILEMLESAKSLLQAAKDVVDNTDEPATEKPKPAKKKRGRPPKKKTEAPKQEDFSVKKQGPSKTPEFTHNKFEEMMGLEVDKPEGYDSIDDSGPRSPRTRGGYKPASLVCQDCSRTFDVNPMFKKDNYVCDRCIGKKFGG